MAVKTIQTIVRTGLTPTYEAVNANDEYPNNGRTFLHVKNGGGSPCNVTVTGQITNPPVGLAAANLVVSVPAGEERMIGPFPKDAYNDPVSGNIEVAYSFLTSVTARAFSQDV